LIANGANPFQIAAASVRAGFAADNYPVDSWRVLAFVVAVANGCSAFDFTEKRFGGNPTDECRRHVQLARAIIPILLVFSGNAYPVIGNRQKVFVRQCLVVRFVTVSQRDESFDSAAELLSLFPYPLAIKK